MKHFEGDIQGALENVLFLKIVQCGDSGVYQVDRMLAEYEYDK